MLQSLQSLHICCMMASGRSYQPCTTTATIPDLILSLEKVVEYLKGKIATT